MTDSPDDLPDDFLEHIRGLERYYLENTDPIEQSGFYGGAERWTRERIVVLEAVEGDGDFMDAACANGYLLACLVEWAGERGIALTPYGLDIGPRLIELARTRLLQYADHFWVGNSWTWRPPREFRYVYTLHDCVPESLLGEYGHRLLERYVAKGGRLIIGAYGTRQSPARDVSAALSECGFVVVGSAACGDPPATRIAWVDR